MEERPLTRISDKVWKLALASNLYYINLGKERVLIDTGDRKHRRFVLQFLEKLVDFKSITKIIFTHLHYDHIGNFDLFPNATLYASSEEINCLRKDSVATILAEEIAEKFMKEALQNLRSTDDLHINELQIIHTPGHTKGSICIWFPEEKVLFTGDTIFKNGYGRTDLPTSAPNNLHTSILKLLPFAYKHLCPGHDY